MTDPALPEILDIQELHRGFALFALIRVRLPDGHVVRREIEDHGDAVAVLPYDPARRTALLVRLFRAPLLFKGLGPELTEAPAGLIDPGETSEQTARREAEEETGVKLGPLESVATVWASPGVSAERITLYLAPCAFDGRAAGGGKPGEHEGITVLEVGLAELAQRCDTGGIEDMKLFALVQTLRVRRPDLFS